MTPWPFTDPPNTAVIIQKTVLNGLEWIGFVSHDDDDGCWQFMGNRPGPVSESDAAVVGLGEAVTIDASVAALADLPLGWRAWRETPAGPWHRAQMVAAQTPSTVTPDGVVLTPPDTAAADATRARQAELTKPPGSLGRLEDLVAWLATWQRRTTPRLDAVDIVIFAGNHGVTARGVSPYPAAVTAQMVANFAAGGAAINQLARFAGARLQVVPLDLDRPTADIVTDPAMTPADFATAWATGQAAVAPGTDLLCLGEMGIGNTTAAAALCTALFGGADWTGLGTGIDPAGLARKQTAVHAAATRHAGLSPLEALRCLGGREMVAIAAAISAARAQDIPVLLDGFVCTAAAAPLARTAPGALDHCLAAHVSAEAAHRRLLAQLNLVPLLDLGLRLGEGSGAALAIALLRAALACHTGIATFAEAAIANRA